MKKLFLIALSLLISFEAQAVVVQNAGNALAYKNVVSKTGFTPKKEIVRQSSFFRVHLTTSDSGSTSMSVGDEVEVSLPESANHSWRASYPSNMVITNDIVEGSVRKITFKLNSKTSIENTIDFDLYNVSTNAIAKSKFATIRIN